MLIYKPRYRRCAENLIGIIEQTAAVEGCDQPIHAEDDYAGECSVYDTAEHAAENFKETTAISYPSYKAFELTTYPQEEDVNRNEKYNYRQQVRKILCDDISVKIDRFKSCSREDIYCFEFGELYARNAERTEERVQSVARAVKRVGYVLHNAERFKYEHNQTCRKSNGKHDPQYRREQREKSICKPDFYTAVQKYPDKSEHDYVSNPIHVILLSAAAVPSP